MSLLSVIIPIYNVEKYLRQCIDSVIQQKIEDMELILVDDGSPDKCPEICDEYAQRYLFVKVIHKKNGGLSDARNQGLKAASGQFVIFMDSDDWWNPNIDVNKLLDYMQSIHSIDMLLFTSYDYIEGEGYFQRNEHQNFRNIDVSSVKAYYQSLLNNGNLEVSANTKILKRQFLIDNQLFFTPNLLSEDNEWMMRVLRVAKKVDKLEEPLYICRLGRADSITNTIKKKNITDLLSIVKGSIDYYANHDNEVKEQELCFASYLWFCALGLANRLNKNELKEVKPLFKETSSVCSYSNSKKTKLSNTIYRVFGFNATIKILGTYLNHKKNDTAKTKVADELGITL